ncbi:hypothetical protein S83_012556, partial [Arachis hypogaea]
GLGVALYTTGSTFVTQHKANMNCSQKPTNTRMRHGWIRNQNMLRFELIVLFGFGMEGWMIAQFGDEFKNDIEQPTIESITIDKDLVIMALVLNHLIGCE